MPTARPFVRCGSHCPNIAEDSPGLGNACAVPSLKKYDGSGWSFRGIFKTISEFNVRGVRATHLRLKASHSREKTAPARCQSLDLLNRTKRQGSALRVGGGGGGSDYEHKQRDTEAQFFHRNSPAEICVRGDEAALTWSSHSWRNAFGGGRYS